MGYQTAPHGSLGLPCGFYQSVSHTRAWQCSFSPNGYFKPPTAPHLPPHPPSACPPKPPGCISLPWRALLGLHGVPNCSSRQSWSPLWILPVCITYLGHGNALSVRMGTLSRLQLPTSHPTPLLPAHPPPIDSICDITGIEENYPKNQQYSSSL